MTTLQWPPQSREDMLAWQEAHGSDKAIGGVVDRSASTVQGHRNLWGVERYSEAYGGRKKEPSHPGQLMSDAAITDIFDDRTYDDVGAA